MKKLFYMGMVALVALMTTALTSCGDDDDTSSNSITAEAQVECVPTLPAEALDAIVAHYQKAVGSDAKVAATGEKTFTFTYNKSKEDAICSKVVNIDNSDLEAKFDEMFVLSYFSIYTQAFDHHHYDYNMNYVKLLVGTFKATFKDKDCTLKITKIVENGALKTTLAYDGNTYEGWTSVQDNESFIFKSTDGAATINSATNMATSFNDGVKECHVSLHINDLVDNSVAFIRQ